MLLVTSLLMWQLEWYVLESCCSSLHRLSSCACACAQQQQCMYTDEGSLTHAHAYVGVTCTCTHVFVCSLYIQAFRLCVFVCVQPKGQVKRRQRLVNALRDLSDVESDSESQRSRRSSCSSSRSGSSSRSSSYSGSDTEGTTDIRRSTAAVRRTSDRLVRNQ
jgi:hypothetical protein